VQLLVDITLPSLSYRVAMTNEFVAVCDSKFTLIYAYKEESQYFESWVIRVILQLAGF
jgi:hypothetical protein